MSNVKRVYVEKKSGFDVQAKELKTEIRSYLGIKDVDSVRVLIRYDVENVSDETFEKACNGIFSEPPVDTLYKEEFQAEEGSKIFSVEFLPGQFDQRADSAVQCIQFIKEDEQPVIRTATTYVIHGGNGTVSDEEFEAIKEHCINPVDSREAQEEKPETLVTVLVEELVYVKEHSKTSMYHRHWYLSQWTLQRERHYHTELKKAGDKLVWLRIETDNYDTLYTRKLWSNYGKFTRRYPRR